MSTYINTLNKAFDQSKKAQLAALLASQKNATKQLNQQKAQTKQTAYGNRNQADVNYFQNLKGLKEQMAANGNYNGGQNLSAQASLGAARGNALGNINTAEQNALSGIGNQITAVNDPSKQNALINQIESQRNQTLASQMWNEHQAAAQQRMQQEQLAQQRAAQAAANYRAQLSANAARDNARNDLLMKEWQMTGKAPSGLHGVAPGTPIYQPPSSSSDKIDAKTSANNLYDARQQITQALNSGATEQQAYDYLKQSYQNNLSPSDYSKLLNDLKSQYSQMNKFNFSNALR